MKELFKKLIKKPLRVKDEVYIHSGVHKHSFGVISHFMEVGWLAVATRDGLLCVRQEATIRYTRGQVFYPGQFEPCKGETQNDEYVKY